MKHSNVSSKGVVKRVSIGIRVSLSWPGPTPFKWWMGIVLVVAKAITHLHSHL
jgi:hypothetical protein